MGTPLFGVDIAGIVADALGDGLPDVTITRMVEGDPDPDNLTGGPTLTPAEFTAKGFWEDFTGTPPPGVELELDDRKLVLIGDTISPGGVPQRNDKCTVHEEAGDVSLFAVKRLARDPASAVYTFLCRARQSSDT